MGQCSAIKRDEVLTRGAASRVSLENLSDRVEEASHRDRVWYDFIYVKCPE